MHRRTSPEEIPPASHCPTAWREMPGGDSVRRCPACRKQVVCPEGLDVEEAARLLAAEGVDVSRPLHRRADGTLLFGDCPVGDRRRGRRRLVGLLACLALACGLFAFRRETVSPRMADGQRLPQISRTAPLSPELWKGAKQPELQILNRAQMIWYPLHKKPVPHALVKTMKSQLLQGDWKGAIASADRLDALIPQKRPDYEKEQPWEWRAAVAELCLFAGEPESAEIRLERIFEAIPAPEHQGLGKSGARQAAAYAMARVKAEHGDFAAALGWLERAPGEYWSGCGNCISGEEAWIVPMRTVWKLARQPYNAAVVKLEAVRAGQFTPVKSLLLGKESTAEQKRHASDEAALILGELHLRNGHPEAARAPLEAAARSGHELAFIARTHLSRL